jgi:hypothetical protein
MSKTNFINQLIVDIRINIISKFYLYVPILVIIIFYCVSFLKDYNFALCINEVNSKLSFGDYLFNIWKGEEIFSQNDLRDIFKIPSFITMYFLYNGFIICRYLNIKRSGNMCLYYIRNKSCYQWNTSKLIWCIINSFLYFILTYSIIFLFALFTGNQSLEISEDITLSLNHVMFPAVNSEAVIFIIMPFLILFSTALIQLFLSLLFRPIIAYVAIILIYVVSLFSCKSYFIYNYAMVLRLKIYDRQGVSLKNGILLNVVIISAVLFLYMILSKRRKENFY